MLLFSWHCYARAVVLTHFNGLTNLICYSNIGGLVVWVLFTTLICVFCLKRFQAGSEKGLGQGWVQGYRLILRVRALGQGWGQVWFYSLSSSMLVLKRCPSGNFETKNTHGINFVKVSKFCLSQFRKNKAGYTARQSRTVRKGRNAKKRLDIQKYL